MIWLLSDPHGEEDSIGLRAFLEECPKSDLLILLGDLELNFRDTDENRTFTEWFLSLDRPIAFVDGNHENHPYLLRFPEEEWCGGRVHRLTPSIIHLKRGEIYELEGKSVFVMGGCKSSARWAEWGLIYEGEDPSGEEIAYACENLKRRENRVDYILTHKYRNEGVALAEEELPKNLAEFTCYLDEHVSFRHWYSGHWHKDMALDERHSTVYRVPIALT